MNYFLDRGGEYFRCSKSANGCCKYSNCLGIKKFETAVKLALEMLIYNEDTADYAHFTKRKDSNELDILYASLKKVQTRLERHKAAYSIGIDSLDEYGENKRNCLQDEEVIRLQIEQLSGDANTNNKIVILKQTAETLINTLFSDEYSIEQKNNGVKTIIDKIVVDKYKKNFDFYYFL